jgi:large subunit ribosomal protein L15e
MLGKAQNSGGLFMSATKYIRETYEKEYSGKDKELFRHYKDKLIQWRKGPVNLRVEKPTNPVRARSLGYKAKKGFVIVRTRIRKGGRRKSRPRSKRRPKRQGVLKYKPHKSLQLMAEERVARHYPNLELLNSYWVGEDGQHKYFEAILVDSNSPDIRSDKDISWISKAKRRVHRGLTSAGKKSRGLKK